MRINFIEVTAKIRLISEQDRKHENMLASGSLTLKDDEGGYFTISGFTIWKSKHQGFNVTVPGHAKFKYLQLEKGTWNKFQKLILNAYESAVIPVID